MTQLIQHNNNPHQPQFYDHAEAQVSLKQNVKPDLYDTRTQNRKVASLAPLQYFLAWHNRMNREADELRQLLEMFMTMHRRFRGVTISDRVGYFGTRAETQGHWIDPDPEEDGEVHPINIVRPDIRANTATLMQINVGIECEPANQNAVHRENAQRIQNLIDFFERDTWTEADRTLAFDGIQKEGTWLIESYVDRETGRSQTIHRAKSVETKYAILNCQPCGYNGKKELSKQQAAQIEGQELPPFPCPKCGAEANISLDSITNHELEAQEIPTAEIKHRFWSGFNFQIDRRGARRGGIQTAQYMRIHELATRSELEADYPHFEFFAPYEWCYALKCQHALESNDWAVLYTSHTRNADPEEFDLFQKNTNMLHESAYKNYVSPENWEFFGSDKKAKFSIRRGETMKEAVERSFGKGTQGIRLIYVNDELVDIVEPKKAEPNFRECMSDIHFLRDSGSYLSVPHWDSAQMQDDVTLFNTLKTEIAARNSVQPVWFDSDKFDLQDFGQEYIPSKEGALDMGEKIGDAVFAVPTSKATDSVTEQLDWLLGVHDKFSDRTPALRGESQPGQPYAAQRQQLEQSYGMLTPASKSYSQMKVQSTIQKIKLAFNNWTIEQFQQVASRFGENWNEEVVASLVKTDLSRDVIIDYIPGTEQPQGNLTKELKFFNALREVMPFIQGEAVAPEIITQILKRIGEFADFDFDLSGTHTVDALAQKRFEQLSDACVEFEEMPRSEIEKLKETILGFDGDMMPITAFEAMTEEIFFGCDIFITPAENFELQRNFFNNEINIEAAKRRPNYFLIEMMLQIITLFAEHEQAAMQVAMENDPETIAGKQEAEAEEKRLADEKTRADEDKAHAKEESETNHAREQEKFLTEKLLEEAGRENERNFEMQKMEKEAEIQAKTQPKANKNGKSTS